MTDFNWNQLADRFQVLDSFAELISGSDKYRFKSLQEVNPTFLWPNIERVADDGTLYLNQTVMNHRIRMVLRLTADEVDTLNPPTSNTRTISYYIYQKNLRNSVMVNISNVYYAKDASSNKYARLNYTFEIEQIGMPRVIADGDIGCEIEGRLVLVNAAGSSVAPTFIRSSS